MIYTESLNIQKGIVAAERLYEVLNLKPLIADSAKAIKLEGFHGCIEFDRVWFRYDKKWVLKDLNYKNEKGFCIWVFICTHCIYLFMRKSLDVLAQPNWAPKPKA